MRSVSTIHHTGVVLQLYSTVSLYVGYRHFFKLDFLCDIETSAVGQTLSRSVIAGSSIVQGRVARQDLFTASSLKKLSPRVLSRHPQSMCNTK